MKTILRIFASISVLLALAACQQFEIDTQMTPEKAAASIRLVCDALESYTAPSTNPSAITFNVSSNTPWTITRSSGADWCSVSPSSSSSSSLISDVAVTLENNTGSEDRSAVLTLKGENYNRTYTIKITQTRQGKLFVTPVAQNYAAVGGPLNFTINTNVDWEIRSSESWLSFSRESGSPDPDGRTITIVATAEPSSVMERSATVTVMAGDDQESFDVLQKGKFELSELSDAFEASESSQTFSLRTDLPWEISADKTWISFDESEGTGDGKVKVITATASANDGALRKATVTVTAGDAAKTFEVTQKGLQFEIVEPASTELDRTGGTLVLEVNSSIEWTPETDVQTWSVEKLDATHMQVTAAWNNRFAPVTGKVAITAAGGAREEVELTQDVNFTFEGNYEILSDGSVKLTGDAATRVKTKDEFRYVKATLRMGECHFASGGQIWFTGQVGSANIYNQITVGGNTRTRTDGNAADGASTYKSTSFSISQSELESMTSYGINLVPNTENDPTTLHFEFLYNGEVRGSQDGYNAFGVTEAGTAYWFGFWNAATADTWYVVESCDITVVEG